MFLGETKGFLLKTEVNFKISNLRCYIACILALTGTQKSWNESGDLSLWGLLKFIRSNILSMLHCRLLWSFLNFGPTLMYFLTRSKSVLWDEPLWFYEIVFGVFFSCQCSMLGDTTEDLTLIPSPSVAHLPLILLIARWGVATEYSETKTCVDSKWKFPANGA